MLLILVVLVTLLSAGCAETEVPYGQERKLALPGARQQVWAIAPAVNLSGEVVDPILQADLLFRQVQSIEGVRAIPVNRTAEVLSTLRIEQVQSMEQAQIVCQMLGADALLVPSVTLHDPYNPPKFGATLTLFGSGHARQAAFDARELTRRAAPGPGEILPRDLGVLQAADVFDAANGTTRDRLLRYAHGRHEPLGPLGAREYFWSMDRFTSFGYHELLEQLLTR
jgi:hypothetical protein